MMRSYLLTIAYDGTGYAGWQRQDGFDTVQERLECAAAVLAGEAVVVHGAGRTDAGVHALRQAAHVRLQWRRTTAELLRALNGNLPRDIVVLAVRPVPAAFHARFSARGKRYLYRFAMSSVRPVLARGYYHWVRGGLDLPAMRAAAAQLVGRHDFASFASNPGYERSRGTVRRIQHLHLVRRPHGIDLVVQGDGFLYNMVRTIAGTLRDVGLGRKTPAGVGEILRACDRRRAGATLEPGALYMVRVLYRPEDLAMDDRTATCGTIRYDPENAMMRSE
ncbi:MAG: tRNA pseudouridine(38-40) synthase TruA [Planctomycetota bacterium]